MVVINISLFWCVWIFQKQHMNKRYNSVDVGGVDAIGECFSSDVVGGVDGIGECFFFDVVGGVDAIGECSSSCDFVPGVLW